MRPGDCVLVCALYVPPTHTHSLIHFLIQNMLEHEDEINARPKRTWFQTEREKRELAKREYAVQTGGCFLE